MGVSAASNVGVSEFIPKPYSAETLLRAIARTIGNPEGAHAPEGAQAL
jgi:FixJ family two-component response regulator